MNGKTSDGAAAPGAGAPRRPGRARDARLEPLEARKLLSTYYVSPAGSDSAAGTSVHKPWKTIARVNQQKLRAGDLVLFQGGKSFSGSVHLPSAETGTMAKPVVFSTYGKGRATLRSGNQLGFDIAQGAGVAITNLNLIGSGMKTNKGPGIFLHLDHANKKKEYFHVRNVNITGYGEEGILIRTSGRGSSLSFVKVEHANLYGNRYGGLKATGSAHNANKKWVIQYVRAYDNPGSKSAGHVTGSGIYIADVQHALVQRSVVYNNGKDGHAPVGIWAAGSSNVNFQYNESYNNRTSSISDGGGFDFDWDVHNSVMQYNYSHGNDGPGFLLYPGSHKGNGNIIRFNVSENDGRKNGKAGIQLGGNVTHAQVYNNTVYITATGHSQSAAFTAHDFGSNGKVATNVVVRNNIFYAAGGNKNVFVTNAVAARGSIKFNGNNLFAAGKKLKIQWGGRSFDTLDKWRKSTGQERSKNKATGYEGNPRLVAPGKGGTINNPDALATLSAYKITGKSKLINRGVPHAGTLASTLRDFFGNALPKGGKHDIGVLEVR